MPKSRVKVASTPVQHRRTTLATQIAKGNYDLARSTANNMVSNRVPPEMINTMILNGVFHRFYEISKRKEVVNYSGKSILNSMLVLYDDLISGKARYTDAIERLQMIEKGDYYSK